MNLIKKPLAPITILTLALLIAGAAVLLLNWANLPEELILRFSKADGVQTLGAKTDFLLNLAIGPIIILINLALANTFYYRERILSILLTAFSALFALLTLIFTALIISIN